MIGDLLQRRISARRKWRGSSLVKAVIWIVALGSGTSGGVLAPLLIIGGALGWLEGNVCPATRASGRWSAWRP